MTEKAIGIVYNLPVPSGALFSEASQDVLTQVDAIENILARLNFHSVRIPFTKDLLSFVQKVRKSGVKMIFNLCETVDEDARFAGHPAAVFELLGLSFSGSPSLALMMTTDKLLTKRLLRAAGISTPKHVIHNASDSFNYTEIKYPVLIKPRFEDAGIGIGQESIVTNEKTLKKRIDEFSERFGELLVEEYIKGREFNLSIFGYPTPRILPVAEIMFKDYPGDLYPIVGYRAKWDKTSFEYQHTPRKFSGTLPAGLKQKLEMTAQVCYRILMLRDYGRIDIRVDDQARVYVLEVNANPCLSPDAGFAAAVENSGMPYEQMVERFISFMNRRAVIDVDQAA